MTPDAADQQALVDQFDMSALTPDFYRDPYPWYHALRTLQPVRRMKNGSYFLTRYDDVMAVYKNPKAFSSDKQAEFGPKYGDSPLYRHHTSSLVFNDPPLHTRVRRLIAGALTPRAIAGMEAGLETLVAQLLDRMAAKGEVDLIEDYASAIPIEVIGNLLAVPHDERSPLRDWSLAILGALEPVLTPQVAERGNTAVTEFSAYLDDLIGRRRRAPGDPAHDVLTRLIEGEEGGERLTPAELLHNCIFLLNAGHETTTNLIGNGLVALHDNPAQRQRLLAEPELIRPAIEEVLRYESSNQLGNRITTEAVEIGGVQMPPQTQVTLCIGAANRDPAQFEQPDQFDIGRVPNRHVAFASGIHQCAGMNLARLEGRVALSALLARFPDFALVAPPVRGGRARFRGFLEIPARVG
jgi:cytochrome P450